MRKIEVALPEEFAPYLEKAANDVILKATILHEGAKIEVEYQNSYPVENSDSPILDNYTIRYDKAVSIFLFGHYLGVCGMYDKSDNWKRELFQRLSREDFNVSKTMRNDR